MQRELTIWLPLQKVRHITEQTDWQPSSLDANVARVDVHDSKKGERLAIVGTKSGIVQLLKALLQTLQQPGDGMDTDYHADSCWFYTDPKGKQQGPFTTRNLLHWRAKDTLKVMDAITHQPFLVMHQPTSLWLPLVVALPLFTEEPFAIQDLEAHWDSVAPECPSPPPLSPRAAPSPTAATKPTHHPTAFTDHQPQTDTPPHPMPHPTPARATPHTQPPTTLPQPPPGLPLRSHSGHHDTIRRIAEAAKAHNAPPRSDPPPSPSITFSNPTNFPPPGLGLSGSQVSTSSIQDRALLRGGSGGFAHNSGSGAMYGSGQLFDDSAGVGWFGGLRERGGGEGRVVRIVSSDDVEMDDVEGWKEALVSELAGLRADPRWVDQIAQDMEVDQVGAGGGLLGLEEAFGKVRVGGQMEHMDEDLARAEVKVVVDTNVLMSAESMRKLAAMREAVGPGAGRAVEVQIVVPYVVRGELNKLKGDNSDRELSMRERMVRAARKRLERAAAEGDPFWTGEKDDEYNRGRRAFRQQHDREPMVDDLVLQCCYQLEQRFRSEGRVDVVVVLLSNDTDMRLNAHWSGSHEVAILAPPQLPATPRQLAKFFEAISHDTPTHRSAADRRPLAARVKHAVDAPLAQSPTTSGSFLAPATAPPSSPSHQLTSAATAAAPPPSSPSHQLTAAAPPPSSPFRSAAEAAEDPLRQMLDRMMATITPYTAKLAEEQWGDMWEGLMDYPWDNPEVMLFQVLKHWDSVFKAHFASQPQLRANLDSLHQVSIKLQRGRPVPHTAARQATGLAIAVAAAFQPPGTRPAAAALPNPTHPSFPPAHAAPPHNPQAHPHHPQALPNPNHRPNLPVAHPTLSHRMVPSFNPAAASAHALPQRPYNPGQAPPEMFDPSMMPGFRPPGPGQAYPPGPNPNLYRTASSEASSPSHQLLSMRSPPNLNSSLPLAQSPSHPLTNMLLRSSSQMPPRMPTTVPQPSPSFQTPSAPTPFSMPPNIPQSHSFNPPNSHPADPASLTTSFSNPLPSHPNQPASLPTSQPPPAASSPPSYLPTLLRTLHNAVTHIFNTMHTNLSSLPPDVPAETLQTMAAAIQLFYNRILNARNHLAACRAAARQAAEAHTAGAASGGNDHLPAYATMIQTVIQLLDAMHESLVTVDPPSAAKLKPMQMPLVQAAAESLMAAPREVEAADQQLRDAAEALGRLHAQLLARSMQMGG